MVKLSSLWKFSRPHTIIGTSLSVFAIYFLAIATTNTAISSANLIQLLGVWIACLFGNVYIVGLNQLVDVEIDKINKPHLPLAAGEFSQNKGQFIVVISGIIALILAGVLGFWLLATVTISLIIGTAYSLPPIRLKRFPFLAALCIFTVRGVIVNLGLFLHFTQKLTGQEFLNLSVWILTLFILVFTVAIAIFKDVPDLEGDQKYQINTFTIILGKKAVFNISIWVITSCYLAIIIESYFLRFAVNYFWLSIGHLGLLALLWWRSQQVDLEQKSEIASFYQFIWKLFFLEYLLFPSGFFIQQFRSMKGKRYLKKGANFRETPHSGYHWHGDSQRFFEGWYFRVSLPEIKQNFAFMYSIDDPCGGKPHSGGAAQIIGINEEYLWRSFPNVNKFWAARNYLALGHWGKTNLKIKPQILKASQFESDIQEGYQVTTTLNQGFIRNPSNNKYCRWQYETEPIYGWGNVKSNQKSTAGLLSFFPIFEPGWQVLMAHGLASGYIDWNGQIYHFSKAPAYSEKNWGSAFPQKWFWINCNSFSNESNLALTAGGGKRKVLWWLEEVAMIAIHYQGKLYEFLSWHCPVNWQIQPWGEWKMQAYSDRFQVTLRGTTNSASTSVRVPTENGLIFACRDTLKGKLQLELGDRQGTTILKTNSDMCGLEVGGAPWHEAWLSS